ncbi:hypothetical protein FRB94_014249 [Tulasnella sp. JGI-2019a]|nr:hypothetical protein FRB93_005402 [Tulasnella sp. JGI-2019a]KAG9014156.1 hypothetical protein FRB94_014249 [Tulasnella sp. JGI-2019a]KAG9022353.1 hypothetical protein FRB95_014921 [Tulasnella sp. JGI-2019a]
MFIPTKAVSILLAFLAVGFASPTPGLVAAGNTVMINSATDFCMIAPSKMRTPILVSDLPSEAQSYCSESTDPQDRLPYFWINGPPTLDKGEGARGLPYIQLTGCINPDAFDHLDPNDHGGQYYSGGESGEPGNPIGSSCTGYNYYVECIDPAAHLAGIRCCQDSVDCPTNRLLEGCKEVIRGNYPC